VVGGHEAEPFLQPHVVGGKAGFLSQFAAGALHLGFAFLQVPLREIEAIRVAHEEKRQLGFAAKTRIPHDFTCRIVLVPRESPGKVTRGDGPESVALVRFRNRRRAAVHIHSCARRRTGQGAERDLSPAVLAKRRGVG